MSWGEVKKINSDLSVPLDERAKYIAGIIPRGMLKKEATKSIAASLNSDVSYSGVLMQVSGSGVLANAYVKMSDTRWNHYEQLVITLDGNKVITLGDTVKRYGDATTATSIKSDVSQFFSHLGIEFPMSVSHGSQIVLNEPLFFKKSLKVEASMFVASNGASVYDTAYVECGVI